MLLDVVAIGEILVDVMMEPEPNGLNWRFVGHPGGAPANAAIAMRRLGKQSGFCGMISSDTMGNWLLDILERERVDCRFVHRCMQPTTLAFVRHTNKDGERDFAFYRENTSDASLETSCIPDSLFKGTQAIHVCSVSLSRSPAREATLFAMRKAKEAGVFVSFDVNWRPMLWQNPQDGQELIRLALGMADFVKISEEELELLEPSMDIQSLVSRVYGHQKPPLLVVTRGSGAATCLYRGNLFSADGYQVKAVDATGAGDAFTGAFLACLAECQYSFPNANSVLEAMRFAHAAAAICVTHNGAISSLPTRNEVCEFLSHTLSAGNQIYREA